MEETAVAGRKDWDTERERTGTRLELQGRRRKQTLENLRTVGELSISTSQCWQTENSKPPPRAILPPDKEASVNSHLDCADFGK